MLTTARLAANLLVPLLGKQGMQGYTRLVKRCTTTRNPRSARARSILLALPRKRDFQMTVVTYPVSFEYATTTDDELNFACRDDFRYWEPVSRTCFALLSMKSQGIVDVGAYSGLYCVTAALANEQATIWAFEPNPRMFPVARGNIHANHLSSRVLLSSVALSDEAGTSRLFLHSTNGESSLASLIGSDLNDSVVVAAKTLDEVLGESRVDLMKIDVEGHEPSVLRGASVLLSSQHPVLLMEALNEEALNEQRKILSEHGYADPIPVASVGDTTGDQQNFLWATADRQAGVATLLTQARALHAAN